MSTNWEAVRTGSLDALGAAIMDRVADQRDDPSSREQEMADACLALIERCKVAESALSAARAEGREEAATTCDCGRVTQGPLEWASTGGALHTAAICVFMAGRPHALRSRALSAPTAQEGAPGALLENKGEGK